MVPDGQQAPLPSHGGAPRGFEGQRSRTSDCVEFRTSDPGSKPCTLDRESRPASTSSSYSGSPRPYIMSPSIRLVEHQQWASASHSEPLPSAGNLQPKAAITASSTGKCGVLSSWLPE
jgi:hypothetical protein